MLRLILIVAVVMAGASTPTFPDRSPVEATADSLYDVQAIDSLRSFASREVERARARGDSLLLGRMTYHRGRARLALREPDAAADFDRALAIAEAIGDSTGCMHALGLQAFVAVNMGQFARSIEVNERRIALARALGRRGSEAWGHLLIGYAELYRENYERAEREYEAAWRAFGEVHRPREQLTASIGLGRALDHLTRYDEARRSYQRAWLTARELGDRNQEADAINNLGTFEQEHGDLSVAAAYFQRSYDIKRELKSFDIASVARNIASIDMMIGRQAHAESTLVDALALGNRGMLDEAMAVELGRLRLARGRHGGAAASFREVLARQSTLPAKARIEAVTGLAATLVARDSLGAAISLLERDLEGTLRDPPSVWRTEAFIEWSRSLRASGQMTLADERARMAFADSEARRDTTLMVLAAAEISLSACALRNDAEALAWFERARVLYHAAPVSGEYQWREARRAALARSLIESGDVLRVAPAGVTDELRQRAHFDFLQQMRARTLLERATDPRRFETGRALAQPVTSETIQGRLLKKGECFLSVSTGEDRLYVFAVTPELFRAGVIDDSTGVVSNRFRNLVRLASREPGGQVASSAAARAIGALVFENVAPLVRGSTRIFASLDGVLAGSPFETLVCPGETDPLIVAHEIVRVPSAAFLQHLRARPSSAASSVYAVAAGAPALRGARAEVNHLASRYRGVERAVDPDRDAFLAAISSFDVVHIASHVRVESERPWHSGILVGRAQAETLTDANHGAPTDSTDPLALSPSQTSEIARNLPVDPFVRASEVAAQRLDANLVVLSACESALGRTAYAEGVLGIASSFLGAGGRAVVASLWQVDDRTTADLMRRFYRELSDGKTVAAALRSAQLTIRASRPAPFFWAGFVVIGDGDVTVQLARRLPTGWLVAIAVPALTLVIALPWAVWRRRSRPGRIAA